jgi:spectinomycin phosphotransferase
MLLPNEDVDEAALEHELREQFRIKDGMLTFAPMGEDSWAYRFGHLWVSVRRDIQGHVPEAYAAALSLRRNGLRFVLAPIAGSDGKIVRTISERPVVVFPYVEVAQIAEGAGVDEREAAYVIDMIDQVHRSSTNEAIPTEDFLLPFDEGLDLALRIADTGDPGVGPYGQRLHDLLRKHRSTIVAMREEAFALSGACAAAPRRLALTHGEPSSGNILRSANGLMLADWGAMKWAPPERDWFHMNRTLGMSLSGQADEFRFYELRWILGEIAEYTVILASPHIKNSDIDAMWRRMTHYLPEPSMTT